MEAYLRLIIKINQEAAVPNHHKLIWTYGCSLWGCASQTNIEVVEREQNVALRTLVHAYRFEGNDDISRDLKVPTVREEIRQFAVAHEDRLSQHRNILAISLLDNSEVF